MDRRHNVNFLTLYGVNSGSRKVRQSAGYVGCRFHSSLAKILPQYWLGALAISTLGQKHTKDSLNRGSIMHGPSDTSLTSTLLHDTDTLFSEHAIREPTILVLGKIIPRILSNLLYRFCEPLVHRQISHFILRGKVIVA